MATRSTLEGVAQLTKQLQALGKLDDGKPLRAATRAGMKFAFNRALATMPVGTEPHRTYDGLLVAPGYAKTTLRIITTLNQQKNIGSAIMTVNKRAYYEVLFVEFGTRYQPAQPWFRRSFFDARNDAENAFRQVLEAAVLKAAKAQ